MTGELKGKGACSASMAYFLLRVSGMPPSRAEAVVLRVCPCGNCEGVDESFGQTSQTVLP